MKLTDAIIRETRAPKKGYRALTDGKRLFLRLDSRGRRSWRLKYVVGGRESQTSLGAYPETSIAAARELAEAIREQAKIGKNPAAAKRAQRQTEQAKAEVTFGQVGLEWLAHDDTLAPRTKTKHAWLFNKLRKLHPVPIAEVKRSDLRTVLQSIERMDDRRETAHRAGQVAALIFAHGMDNYEDIVKHNPAVSRKGWLKPKKSKRPGGHLPGITDRDSVGHLMKIIDGHNDVWNMPTVTNALRFLARVFVRQDALCGAEWSEFYHLDDPTKAEWRIPARRMKGPIGQRRAFTVPLSRQAIEILDAQRQMSSEGRYVFPHASRPNRCMSTGALSARLGALFYEPSVHTPHGFRTTAATLLREKPLAYDSDLVELALAHSQSNKVRGAYDRAERMDERREMLQAYADYLDKLKARE
ncbi:MAG: tyrosine-type recombinase/integrase [Steroidobacteraceae bacterium]